MSSRIRSKSKPFSLSSLGWLKKRFLRFVDSIDHHRIFMLTGSIAYTTALSLAPFVLILLAAAALVNQKFQNQMYAQMTEVLGSQAGAAIKLVVENADNSRSVTTISGLLGVLVLALGASAIFSQLRAALDIINETIPEAANSGIWGFVRDKFLSLGLVLGFVFLAVTSLAVTTLISSLFEGREAVLWTVISFALNLSVFTGLFTAMFYFLPSRGFGWRHSLIAGFTGTIFFLIGKSLIGLYLGNASVGSAYGAAGTLVVFLVWVYYTSLILLISYEFTNTLIVDIPKAKSN